jgi:phage terminase Nu1 subunit (DNA packaging protein)
VRAKRRAHFALGESVKTYVACLRRQAAGYLSADGKFDVTAESARLKRAQRELLELSIAKDRGKLIQTAFAVELLQELVRNVRDAILSFPRRASADYLIWLARKSRSWTEVQERC